MSHQLRNGIIEILTACSIQVRDLRTAIKFEL